MQNSAGVARARINPPRMAIECLVLGTFLTQPAVMWMTVSIMVPGAVIDLYRTRLIKCQWGKKWSLMVVDVMKFCGFI